MMNINLIYKSEVTDNIPELHYDKWWGCHTFETLLPPDKYFGKHPEYYSQRCGVRIASSQLCLTNPEVVDLVAENLIDFIAKNPQYEVYDLSQNDNEKYCRCKECRKAARRYGQSGVMINFVNQVAARVKEVYPDKKIGTFAYLYTRQVPKDHTIIPADNVIVRLCDIECCWVHPLNEKWCCRNRKFMRDFEKWKGITKNLAIWDYCVNFWNTHGPFPNIDALYENVRLFKGEGYDYFLEEGCYTDYGELNELRCSLIKKTLEYPNHNLDIFIENFINKFYRQYDVYVSEYVRLLRGGSHILPFWKFHLKAFQKPWSWYLKKSFLKKAIKLLNVESDGTEYADRVDKLFMGVGMTYCWRYPKNKLSKEIYPKVKELLIKNNVQSYKESDTRNIDEFFEVMEYGR